MIRINELNKKELETILKNSSSYGNFLDKIGYAKSGNAYKHTKKYLDSIDVDYSFINTPKWSSAEKSVEEVFKKGTSFCNKGLKSKILKYKLLQYECTGVNCGNTGQWLGKSLILQLDHKNGDSSDNRLENLRFLCPNCHSQTETYAGKNKK